MSFVETIYEVADELRGIASAGLHFSEDPYDIERYEKVLELSARLVGVLEDRPIEEVHQQFQNTLFHLSPLIGVSSVVLSDGKILLIQRTDNGLWTLPGGLVEVGESLSSAALRELKEEAGVSGRAVDLLGIFDSRLWKTGTKNHLYHVALLVEVDDPRPTPGIEALAAEFFSKAELPPLAVGQAEKIPVLFDILKGDIPRPFFDGRVGMNPSSLIDTG
jgi:ADP-ribose pyrophosphatase YjhB (NUDIX family)